MLKDFEPEERKRILATAVWEVILSDGIGGLSVRKVASVAGVSLGSLRHIFPSRAELLEFSAELMLSRAALRIQSIPLSNDLNQYALKVLQELLPLHEESKAELEINLAIIAESPALPSLLGIRNQTKDRLNQACETIIRILTQPQAIEAKTLKRHSLRLNALIDGLALHLLHQSNPETVSAALELLESEIAEIRSSAVKS